MSSAETGDRTTPIRAFAPGRINLIGEHTDYNDGLCLPFALERGVTVTADPLERDRIEVHALDLGEEDSFELSDRSGAEGWRAFARGTVAELAAAGHAPRGCTLSIESDLPREAGLSSSAALAVALALALLEAAGVPEPDRVELAKLCSRVENDWVGAETGLLDQLASLLGREGMALRLDLRSLDAQHVPIELGGWTLATLDSGAARSLGDSGYNDRREECRLACRELGLSSLREATAGAARGLPSPLDRRVRHVITENERVERAVAALATRDLASLGSLLDASHASLRDDYQVSVPEVERTVEACKAAGAAGARVMGGGFGGSVLALYPAAAEPPAGSLTVTPGPAARLL